MKRIKKYIHHIISQRMMKVRTIITDTSGEGFVDTAVKILISIVIGALLLAGLYALFGDTILPTLTERINDMFNYEG
ncbi:MAG: hypothetical protein EOM59_06560 [Clostridia bacterium]|nr:hypothetical protein [Clostridia bacterium]